MSKAAAATPAPASDPPSRVLTDYVCTLCGCACDDLTLTVEGQRITKVEPPCPAAEAFFLQPRPMFAAPCLVDGKPAEFADAIDRAAAILRDAQAPLVMGFEHATCDAQRAAAALADRLGAVIDPTDTFGQSRSHEAVQTVGAVTATLGEVAARADLVVYWAGGRNPMTTHPRHMERFARRPLIARGTESLQRRVITVGTERTQTAEASDEFLQLRSDGDEAALAVLRALVRGVAVDEASVQSQTGAPIEQWAYLAQRLKMARYAAIFHYGEHAATVTDLVRELHRHTRAVALSLGEPPNAVGAAQVLTWQTGFPASVDFSAGHPVYRPSEASAVKLLECGEVDAALIIAANPLEHYKGAALDRLQSIPTVVIDDRESPTARSAAVAFFTACFGIETAGDVFRSDGVALPLGAALPTPLLQAEQVLQRLGERLPRNPPAPSPLRGGLGRGLKLVHASITTP
jgi:formylmethanofuran dehydrogenase subunit B